jgi:beta-phosphoglucomutase-like phosphatase (HAD superfamily)
LRIKAVVFDFDGVLANSEPLHFRAFRDVAAQHGLSLSETAYYTRYLGYDDVGAFRAIAADAGVPLHDDDLRLLVGKKAQLLEALERDTTLLFPGAKAAASRMAAVGPMAIASGALRAEIERVLGREGMRDWFQVVVAAEDTPASKPDPAPYVLAVEALSFRSGLRLQGPDCVAIEDSRWGLESARRAGLKTIGITHSYTADDLAGADVIINRLDELRLDLLGRFA